MRIFVIGASGYLGAKIYVAAQQLYPVFGTTTTGLGTFIRFDLSCPEVFDYDSLVEGDTILLTAAISSPDICAREYQRVWETNVVGTSKFINEALSHGAKVMFFSSDTVYGEQHDAFDERMACSPAGEYAAMKHDVEELYLGSVGFKVVRLSYVFSIEDKFTQYLLGCARKGVTAEAFAPFDRAVVHRDDVVLAVLNLAVKWDTVEAPIINVGGPQVLGRAEFAEIIRQEVVPGLALKVTEPSAEFFTNRPSVIRMESPLLSSLLGRTPRSLAEAVKIEFNSNNRSSND
jgi:dTDP-4-dehydrorhamnose reductase